MQLIFVIYSSWLLNALIDWGRGAFDGAAHYTFNDISIVKTPHLLHHGVFWVLRFAGVSTQAVCFLDPKPLTVPSLAPSSPW